MWIRLVARVKTKDNPPGVPGKTPAWSLWRFHKNRKTSRLDKQQCLALRQHAMPLDQTLASWELVCVTRPVQTVQHNTPLGVFFHHRGQPVTFQNKNSEIFLNKTKKNGLGLTGCAEVDRKHPAIQIG